MNAEQAMVMHECAKKSVAGELTFPEIIGRLAAVGVERYHLAIQDRVVVEICCQRV